MAELVPTPNLSNELMTSPNSINPSLLEKTMEMKNVSGQVDEKPVKREGGNTLNGAKRMMRSTRATSTLELHRRCNEMIARCIAKLRERECKMKRLQLLLPLSNLIHPRHCITLPKSTISSPRLARKSTSLQQTINLKNLKLSSTSRIRLNTTSFLLNKGSKLSANFSKFQLKSEENENGEIARDNLATNLSVA